MKNLIEFLKQIDIDIESIFVHIPSQSRDLDMNKIHVTKLGEEILVYHEIKNIANTTLNNIDWTIAIKYLSEAVFIISDKIKNNQLKYPEQLEEFIKNCNAIYNQWNYIYKKAFDLIKEYKDNIKKEKSIDDMDADELREYIRTHNIK